MSGRTVLSYRVEYHVFDSTITDMLDAAGYGITYWATDMEFAVRGDRQYVVITDEDGTVHEVTYRKLREAFGKLVDPEQGYVGSTIHGYFLEAVNERDRTTGEVDAGHIDSDAADVWVQVALFDEVRFG